MNKLMKISRRGLVRIISFVATLVVILAVTAIVSFTAAYRYRTSVEYTYQRALSELSDYIGNIDMELRKGQYANTTPQIQNLATKLWQETGNAKAALAQLPGDHTEIGTTTKFLSQLGNYCMTLSKRVADGGTVTEEEQKTLDTLAGYASDLAGQLRQMQADVQSGAIHIGGVQTMLESGNVGEKAPDIASGFRSLEDNFDSYPSMIYDGPFSDHIQQQTSLLLKGRAEVDAGEAMKTASAAVGGENLQRSDDVGGNLPCYRFLGENKVVTITKAGGLLECILGSRELDEPRLSKDEALKKAEEVLKAQGITQFENRYYEINGGVLIANYAVTQKGVVLYPDLVKVSIALDNGGLYGYDARGYILNHTERDLTDMKVTEEEARAVLNDRLTPESHNVALIPTDGLQEVLCHEFLCTGRDGEKVLVYINGKTGYEEQILILIENENGVLAI